MRVGIVGSGAMGSGIAEAFLLIGDQVVLFDIEESQLRRCRERISEYFAKQGRRFSEDAFKTTADWESFEEIDFAIEAVSEEMAVKRYVFAELDRRLLPPRVLATNTSSLFVARIAQACANPERVIGMHFFNPVRRLKFIEIAVAAMTNSKTIHFALEQTGRLGREYTLVKDAPGFVANRILMPFFLEALRMVSERQISPAVLDGMLKSRGAFPMGPFELADLVGLDVNGEIAKTLYTGLGRAKRFLVDDLGRSLIKKRQLGRKTGIGFYKYNGKETALNDVFGSFKTELASQEQDEIFLEVMGAVINEAFLVLEEGTAFEADIEKTMKFGCNWPQGPFEFFNTIGPNKIKEVLFRRAEVQPKQFQVSKSLIWRAEGAGRKVW